MTDKWRWSYTRWGRRHKLRRDKNDIEVYCWRLDDQQLQGFCDAGTASISGQRARVGEFYARPLRHLGEHHITWIRRQREPSNMRIADTDLIAIITAADHELRDKAFGVPEVVHISR